MKQHLALAALAAALSACIAPAVDTQLPDGSHRLTGTYDHRELTTEGDAAIAIRNRAAELCPAGYDKLAESDVGAWPAGSITWTVRCKP